MNKNEFKLSNENGSTLLHEVEGVPFLAFDKLTKAGVKHGFSTRLGGVSKEHLYSMNLSFSRGDEPENVFENYKRIGNAIGFKPEQLVFSDQQHETVIRKVSKMDAGKGITKERDYDCVDGLVTDEEGLCLATFYADCVPLFFYDPVKKVIGMAHSGWRGTVGRIGRCMIEKMQAEYGSNPSDIICAIGPSICKECYEVSQDVYDAFAVDFSNEELVQMFRDDHNGKYHLDLWKTNEIILLSAGIQPEHLDMTDICTCCNPELLYSHRASKGMRGNLAGFMML